MQQLWVTRHLTTTVWTVWGQSSRFFVATVTAKPARASFGLRALVWLMCISNQYLVMTVRVCCLGMSRRCGRLLPSELNLLKGWPRGTVFLLNPAALNSLAAWRTSPVAAARLQLTGGTHGARAACGWLLGQGLAANCCSFWKGWGLWGKQELQLQFCYWRPEGEKCSESTAGAVPRAHGVSVLPEVLARPPSL